MGQKLEEGLCTADLTRFPILRISSPQVAQYDRVSVPSFFACLDLGLARDELFVVLHDARGIPHVGDDGRKLFQALLEPRRQAVIERVAGYAGVVSSPLERGLLTAFMWFIRLPLPIRLFSNETDAVSWLLERHAAVSDQQKRTADPA